MDGNKEVSHQKIAIVIVLLALLLWTDKGGLVSSNKYVFKMNFIL